MPFYKGVGRTPPKMWKIIAPPHAAIEAHQVQLRFLAREIVHVVLHRLPCFVVVDFVWPVLQVFDKRTEAMLDHCPHMNWRGTLNLLARLAIRNILPRGPIHREADIYTIPNDGGGSAAEVAVVLRRNVLLDRHTYSGRETFVRSGVLSTLLGEWTRSNRAAKTIKCLVLVVPKFCLLSHSLNPTLHLSRNSKPCKTDGPPSEP